MAEEILELGYINEEMKHAMISVKNPTLLNDGKFGNDTPQFCQLVITIESAIILKAKLDQFLKGHIQ